MTFVTYSMVPTDQKITKPLTKLHLALTIGVSYAFLLQRQD